MRITLGIKKQWSRVRNKEMEQKEEIKNKCIQIHWSKVFKYLYWIRPSFTKMLYRLRRKLHIEVVILSEKFLRNMWLCIYERLFKLVRNLFNTGLIWGCVTVTYFSKMEFKFFRKNRTNLFRMKIVN